MRIAITGASGMIGRRLAAALRARGDELVLLSRRASGAGGVAGGAQVVQWEPTSGPAPGLSGVDAVVNLAGEPIAQRWSAAVKDRIRTSRVQGTANLVAGLAAADPRPRVLVSTSAAGFYGDRGESPLEESEQPGPRDDFLASVCIDWEDAAEQATELGARVAIIRNGVVLDRSGGALAKMLPAFKLGLGGPIAGGRQYMAWIALDDVVDLYIAALDGAEWTGPVNAAAPSPATNGQFSRALGRALHRPAFAPVPALALRLLFGEMASILLASQRAVPARAVALGYQFRWAELEPALAAVLD
ncbi:MAG: TIGR01777 family oxidoreductase [Solirubrobacteraceae bacterium]